MTVRVDPDAIAQVFARRGIMLDEMDIITEVWRITPMFYPGECCAVCARRASPVASHPYCGLGYSSAGCRMHQARPPSARGRRDDGRGRLKRRHR
jgi:hypothetical protein